MDERTTERTLESLRLRIDDPLEDARRMAAIMEAGLHSEWISYFAKKGMLTADDLVSDQSVIRAAARYLRQMQIGDSSKEKILLMAIRQALIIALGAIEDYLGVERSIIPRRKRQYGA